MSAHAPSRRDLRLTGAGMGTGLAALGLLMLSRHSASAPYLIAASAVALVVAALAPGLFLPLMLAGRAIGRPLVWLATRASLLLVFYVVVTPIAVVGRLLGARFSDSDFSKRRQSYWVTKDKRARTAGEYEKQY
jgi:hypothetical protein